jgi:hypothetical protein
MVIVELSGISVAGGKGTKNYEDSYQNLLFDRRISTKTDKFRDIAGIINGAKFHIDWRERFELYKGGRKSHLPVGKRNSS